ncbi:SKA3 protein, partial [Podargus strigoides]|nr:SKA3 protein [Podargus strigoides]
LKKDVDDSLRKSCSEKQAIHDFMKASEILIQRNATDLGKIREVFQKYSYKPHVKDSAVDSDSTVSVQNKSDEDKADDVPHLPPCTEKPLVPKDPLCNPRLSDFGLSHYAFSMPWSAVKKHATNAHQENLTTRTPLKTYTPSVLPKTPKCMLKMDDYECVTPKLEHFGISEHTMCMNEDYTMSLLRKTAQKSKNIFTMGECTVYLLSFAFLNHLGFEDVVCSRYYVANLKIEIKGFKRFRSIDLEKKPSKPFSKMPHCRNSVLSLTSSSPTLQTALILLQLVEEDDCEVKVPEMTPRKIMVTPVTKPKVAAENADWMVSPMVLVFCTPDVKISSTNNLALSRSSETNVLHLSSRTRTPQVPDFETRWIKREAKVVNSNYVHFHILFTIGSFSYQVKQGEKIELVIKNDATDKQCTKDSIPFAMSSDEYLKHFGDPSPPNIKHYDQLLSTPPPPEITRIPDDVLQILSRYNHKDSSKAKEMETKAGHTTRYESDFTDYSNKENR